MDERWHRLVEAVGDASTLEPEAARARLEARLKDDPHLLAEALSILEGGTDDDDFLRHGPAGVAPSAALAEGSAIGPYKLLRILGQGGMGTVFLAHQETPDRMVALKILRGALLSPTARRRLEYEIQALASLRHPGIAQVYQAGVHVHDDGLVRHERPWFAMEYVEDAATLLDHAERERLSRDARLALFLEVCDAVQHAHQKGVVHRDLKPDNILVSPEGRPKVIDFGVARSTDAEAPLTTIGTGAVQIVGTLPYLSPERVTGGRDAADVRTDVYALGVVLYQLLTGRLPIEVDPTDIVTSAQRIVREPPLRPRRARPGLPQDLEAILLETLAKDPAERYASVEALAADVRRFLEGLPVQARPPSVAHQLRLFARRNKVLVLSAAVVAAALIAGTIVSLRFAFLSSEAEHEAVAERERAEGVVQVVLRRNIDNALRFAPAVNELAGGQKLVEAFMNSVAEDLAELDRLAKDDPRVKILLARTYIRLGDTQGNDVYANLGRPEDARASYRKALELARAVPPDRDARVTAIDAQLSLGELLLQDGRRLRRAGKSDEALRVERRQRLTEALQEAEALRAEHPDDQAVARFLATIRNRLGSTDLEEGDPEAARRHAEAILAIDPEGTLRVLRLAHDLLGPVHAGKGDWDAAVVSYRYLVDVAEREAEGPHATFANRSRLSQALRTLGLAAAQAGDFEAAVPAYERMVALGRALLAENPDRGPQQDMVFAIQVYDLGAVCVAAADATEDESERRDLLAKALAAYREAARTFDPDAGQGGHAAGLGAQLKAEIERIEALIETPEER